MKTTVVRVPTGQGPAEVLLHPASGPSGPVGTLVLTHGAGGDVNAPDLAGLASSLPDIGWNVALVRMPWRVAGKKFAPRPAVIDACYAEVLDALDLSDRFVLGGRSAGARSACRVAGERGASGVLALSFPLHPPGKPEKSRLHELQGAGLPTLVLQGERDPFGGPAEFPSDLAALLVTVPAADHSLKVPKRATISQDEAIAVVVDAVAAWLAGGSGIGEAPALLS